VDGHRAVGGALDGDGIARRDRAIASLDLEQELLRHADRAAKRGLTWVSANGFVNHAASKAQLYSSVKALFASDAVATRQE
jgi:hypothetical protein